MPKGYSGAPARNFFRSCDDAERNAHSAINRAAASMPSLSPPALRRLTYTEADAAFNGGIAPGHEDSSSIVSNAAAHAAAANEHRIFGEYISSFLRHACVVINNVVETDLNMPQVRVQVQLVTQSLNLLIPDLKSRMEEAENYTNRQSEAMQGAAGGGFTGLEMQQTVADGCRSDNENDMNLTVMDMQDFAERGRQQAAIFEAQADALRSQLSAKHDPDPTARAAAQEQIARLESKARDYREAAARLDMAADDLDSDIRVSGRLFETDCDEVIAIDADFSREFDWIADEIRRLAGLFQDIRDSFCPTSGITNFAPFLAVKARLPIEDQDAMFTLIVEAMAAELLNGPDGEPNWGMIEEWLQTDLNKLSEAQLGALVFALMSIEGSAHFERFINSGYRIRYDMIEGEHGFLVTSNVRYSQTGTFEFVSAMFTETVADLALATAWATHPLFEFDSCTMERLIHQMQILQIISAEANNVSMNAPSSVVPPRFENGISVVNMGSDFSYFYMLESFHVDGWNPNRYNMSPNRIELDASARTDLTWNVGDNAASEHIGSGCMLRSTARSGYSAIMSNVRSAIIKVAIPKVAVAKYTGIALGIALSVYNDRAAYANRRVQAGAFLDELAFSEGLEALGARVFFTNVNGRNIIHGVNFETPEVLLNSYGFLSQNPDLYITSDVLHNIVLNGVNSDNNDNWRYLQEPYSGGLTEAQQLEVFGEFQSYRVDDESKREFNRALRDVREELNEADYTEFNQILSRHDYVEGDDKAYLPPEAIRFLIERNR